MGTSGAQGQERTGLAEPARAPRSAASGSVPAPDAHVRPAPLEPRPPASFLPSRLGPPVPLLAAPSPPGAHSRRRNGCRICRRAAAPCSVPGRARRGHLRVPAPGPRAPARRGRAPGGAGSPRAPPATAAGAAAAAPTSTKPGPSSSRPTWSPTAVPLTRAARRGRLEGGDVTGRPLAAPPRRWGRRRGAEGKARPCAGRAQYPRGREGDPAPPAQVLRVVGVGGLRPRNQPSSHRMTPACGTGGGNRPWSSARCPESGPSPGEEAAAGKRLGRSCVPEGWGMCPPQAAWRRREVRPTGSESDTKGRGRGDSRGGLRPGARSFTIRPFSRVVEEEGSWAPEGEAPPEVGSHPLGQSHECAT